MGKHKKAKDSDDESSQPRVKKAKKEEKKEKDKEKDKKEKKEEKKENKQKDKEKDKKEKKDEKHEKEKEQEKEKDKKEKRAREEPEPAAPPSKMPSLGPQAPGEKKKKKKDKEPAKQEVELSCTSPFRDSKRPFGIELDGALVVDLADKAPASNIVQIGWLLLSVDGKPVPEEEEGAAAKVLRAAESKTAGKGSVKAMFRTEEPDHWKKALRGLAGNAGGHMAAALEKSEA
eukprot:CAMPEP_0195079698 /NCGR_PEP_ID=MMETSP0448-20130528/21570_1 /TAXON_ID=66468 /ORGANISM="Heterocapsa triquestra, Strain CCMP 448" /LENGTH=230 /DNA_ID=CAMNT_0040112575 /DNA_START=41 /DNA_END=731 /DNA_ORIENTATION=-